jgi:hypothetical protein
MRRRWTVTSAVLSIVLSGLAVGAASAAHAQQRTIGDFSLVSAMHGKCVTVPDVTAVPAENMPLARMMPCKLADEESQRWTYSAATGEFRTHDGFTTCLDAYRTRRGDPIMVHRCRGGNLPGQGWDTDSRGRIVLRDVVGPEGQRYCVTIANGDRSDGARLWLQYCHDGENQIFRRDADGKGGSVVSIESDLRSPNSSPGCVDVPARENGPVPGLRAWLWTCQGAGHTNQRWERTAAMEFRLETTVTRPPTMCLDGGAGTYNSPVTLQRCDGRASQKWNMLGYGELQLQDGNRQCLTVPNDNNTNGNKLVMAPCNTSIALGQRWSYRDASGLAAMG